MVIKILHLPDTTRKFLVADFRFSDDKPPSVGGIEFGIGYEEGIFVQMKASDELRLLRAWIKNLKLRGIVA